MKFFSMPRLRAADRPLRYAPDAHERDRRLHHELQAARDCARTAHVSLR